MIELILGIIIGFCIAIFSPRLAKKVKDKIDKCLDNVHGCKK